MNCLYLADCPLSIHLAYSFSVCHIGQPIYLQPDFFSFHKHYAVAVQQVNHTTTGNSATFWFQVSNITCNLTVSYEVCSDATSRKYSTLLCMSPAVHLMNLTAESTYCYSISTTDSESDKIVVGSCNGTFTTEATSGKQSYYVGKHI